MVEILPLGNQAQLLMKKLDKNQALNQIGNTVSI